MARACDVIDWAAQERRWQDPNSGEFDVTKILMIAFVLPGKISQRPYRRSIVRMVTSSRYAVP